MLALAPLAAPAARAQVADLVDHTAFRVCADPANLPLSSQDGTGFENRIADLFAAKLGVPVQYTWFPQVIGFVRQTLGAGKCDVVIGFAQGDELVLNTNHYYTSTHVLVVRADGDLTGVDHLSDPALKGRKIGVVAGAPPATHVARLGLMKDAKPYDLMTDRRVENPAGDMLHDVETGATDAALMWGPIAGPLAKDNPKLKVIPLLRETTTPRLFFRITMGVRPGEDVWKRELNSMIRRNQGEIDAILRDAGVPLVDDYGKQLKPVAP
ncbi:quinoprotein dehydrogenase-associated putative ABC transporter substrate-binding protein [Paracoccus yeei]|uniref:Quinoprotein dehydrogenase-associated putative ABC transporter substrate-binding protein n=2 Tax=Paracoccus yeei TaxID=147645 RepID=A0A1V0GX86_9RHOB|nr:quinoprotein dehydrogenase-associated putative ABC transporter substrate-binding protein [Paracoccus yeei]ATQ57529.1 quinoprotein dehydrogenase-associated putative ABC transporter substrate-binding protein [Paracoccus yeei]MBY0136449.1 quinoprotein dehydrogenase-associated putative ABC transporter substrate-binding protein [Paracoccus yeei]OWJ90704.1 quinoprotein dehydrogenase-associated putative ABC transporter substrate-binding protein [Paracoccus yeei]QEU10414.1 quinoprotein dehydrogenase